MSSLKSRLSCLVLSSMFLALAIVLPIFTGQIPQIGNSLCPMHIPVLLCGFFCGPWYGMFIGFAAPLLRLMIFGMPPFVPIGVSMCFELACYGFVSGSLYNLLPRKKINIYISLIGAMFIGRLMWGIVRVILSGLGKFAFGWEVFISGAFLNAIPGIIIQVVCIPTLVIKLEKIKE